ncbi:MAG: putative manganese-dependent inorganic diphosphatase [Chloroflexi bacterium]|nr:putative manganese-dependent inorganic diphosphatase [Chloroflexota bacterium]
MKSPEYSPIPILVVGHTNPDTDAVCSALAYADAYQQLTGETTIACHLDEVAPETQWVLEQFQLAPPRAIADVYLHVRDVMERDVPRLRPEQTVRAAGLIMQERGVGALPVVDDHDVLIGLLTREALADRYLEQLQLSEEIDLPVAVLLQTLEATLVSGDALRMLRERAWIATQRADTLRHSIRQGDIVIVGDQPDVQRAVIEGGAGCLILTDDAPLDDDLIAIATERALVVLRTRYSPFAAALLIAQSVPVGRVMQPEPLCCLDDDLLSEAQTLLRNQGRASLPVVNVRGQLQGLLLRRHLAAQSRRRVILTDHNHPDQTAPGVPESEIIAIIDHHNLGGLQTLRPLTILCEPVGCTCTLIAELYQRNQLQLTPQLAAGMLAAILSDTVHFRSPTTTDRDRRAVAWLEQQSQQDAATMARGLFRARLPRPTPPAAWWVESNLKTYTFGNHSIGIGQVELTEIETVMPPIEQLQAALSRIVQQQRLTTAFLLLTDILDQDSLLLAADAQGEQLAVQAFGQPFVNGSSRLEHVMSRKKQVVPRIAAVLADGS